MKKAKYFVIVLLVVLLIATVAFLSAGAWMPVFGVITGYLFIYYSIVLLLIFIFKNKKNKVFRFIIYLLILIPIVWIAIDAEGIIDNVFDSAMKGFKYQI